MGLNLYDYIVLGVIGVGVITSVENVNESVQELNRTVENTLETTQPVDSEFESNIRIEDVNKDGIPDLYVVIGDKKFVAYGK